MIFRNDESKYNEVFTFGTYHRYWNDRANKNRNPDFDDFSRLVLDLKDENTDAIEFFRSECEEAFSEGIAVAYVPSHDPQKTSSGVRKLAELLAKNGRIDATSCLVRIRLVPKLADGGDRSIAVHYNSLKVRNADLIKDQTVLLLDDVATSENSLRACKRLLRQAGAKRVKMVAIGKNA